MTSLCFVFLVFAGVFVVSHAQNIIIEGNDEPLISGLEQDITCSFTGRQNVTLIEWGAVVGDLEFTAAKDTSGASVLVLTLTPGLSSDGSQFKCRVIDSSGRNYEKNITISVKSLELTLNITALASNPVAAGSSLTLHCVATSDRVPHLKWIDSDGNTIQSGNGTIVSAITTSGETSNISLTFSTLRTSHAKIYTCRSEIDVPPSNASTSYLVTVQIPAPVVTTVRDPSSSTQLFTTNSLVLICLVELDAAVDTSVAANTQWSVTPSAPHVAIFPALRAPPYPSLIQFFSLKLNDTGTYVCTVQVTSVSNSNVIASLPTSQSIDISVTVGLNVDIVIEYEPPYDYEHPTPPYYRPCTGVSLVCEVYGASETVTYTWTSSNSDSFINGKTERNVGVARLTSNDNGLHKCCVRDGNDNVVCANTEMIIKGIGIYIEESEYISGHGVPNNSFVVAKSTPCTNCRLDIYCCSEASTGTAYIEFPDSVRKESSDDYNNVVVEQLSDTAGIRVYNYQSYLPQLYGLYTCHAPSLQEEIMTASVTVYGNDLKAPTDDSRNDSTAALTIGVVAVVVLLIIAVTVIVIVVQLLRNHSRHNSTGLKKDQTSVVDITNEVYEMTKISEEPIYTDVEVTHTSGNEAYLAVKQTGGTGDDPEDYETPLSVRPSSQPHAGDPLP